MRPVLDKMGVNVGQLAQIVDAELKHLPKSSGGAPPQASRELMTVFENAQAEADAMKDEFVSTEHLLLALAKTSRRPRTRSSSTRSTRPELLKALAAGPRLAAA